MKYGKKYGKRTDKAAKVLAKTVMTFVNTKKPKLKRK